MGILDRNQVEPFDVVDVVDPGTNDDTTAELYVGALWFNSVTKNVFRLVDDTAAAAEWTSTTDAAAAGDDPCLNRDQTSRTILARKTCLFNNPEITGRITVNGDGRMLVLG